MSEDNGASSSMFSNEPAVSQRHNVVKSYGISIDSSRIHEVAFDEQPESLRALGVNIFDQDVFEEGVLQQVDEAIAAQEEDLARWKLDKELKSIEQDLCNVRQKIKRPGLEQHGKQLLQHDIEQLSKAKDDLVQKLQAFSKQKVSCEDEIENEYKLDETSEENSLGKVLDSEPHEETEIERLVRLGEMTPFGTTVGDRRGEVNIDSSNHDQDIGNSLLCLAETESVGEKSINSEQLNHATSNDDVRTDGDITGGGGHDIGHSTIRDVETCCSEDDPDVASEADHRVPAVESDEEYIPDEDELKLSFEDDEHVLDDDIEDVLMKSKQTESAKKVVKKSKRLHKLVKDDGDDRTYQIRIREYKLKKSLREKGIEYEGHDDDEEEFWHEEGIDEEFDEGLKIPGFLWNKLFRYQKTGVKWLWELHCQKAGGIVGDEMGLGKTVQVIAFLAGLKYSNIGRRSSKQNGLGPILIICPATVLFQWVAEFQKWWPEFRVAVLHDTGSYKGPKDTLITRICNEPGVLLTTYSGVRLNQDILLPLRWDYVILDEGHIIRNPDAEVTLTCKQFRTPHRLMLSGSPMQNNLRELWSLFDFVFPGKLGTLPVFMQEFSVPITMGGYSNATSVQVQTAYKCACVLRDTINPYLLRRLKKDVKKKLNLPNKNEQVLFCRLTEEQTEIYKEYLASREVGSILSGNMKVFPGLIMLRKICNHPDLTTKAGSLWKLRKDKEQHDCRPNAQKENDAEYGFWKRSGKLIVVHSLLKLWKKQKHKVLLFTQTRQMLKILEIFVKFQHYSYCRMDGSTSISSRQPLIDKFNKDKSIFVFLLTTRVGGLGVNLVGADRVVIYDPDWNPGTDMQARERAWRVGQKNDITIYRLLTTGTIEEKIYHRQIFKQFLTNRVLKDPKQRRFFKSNDLFELFTLDTSDAHTAGTETEAIFAGLGCEVNVPQKSTGSKRKQTVHSENVSKRIRERAKEILKTQFSNLRNEQQNQQEMEENEENMDTTDNKESSTEIAMGITVITASDNSCVPSAHHELLETSLETQNEGLLAQSDHAKAPNYLKTTGKIDSEKLDIAQLEKRNEIKKQMKKKKKKTNKVEGISIGQLSHFESFNNVGSGEANMDRQDDDDYILRKLFKKSGVHSALQHDTIVDSGHCDHVLVENEAKRVALQAAEALKRSREQCLQLQHTGLPTWTGLSGVVGSPHGVQQHLFGPKMKTGHKEKLATMFSGKMLTQRKETTDRKPGLAASPMTSAQLLSQIRARNAVPEPKNAIDLQCSEKSEVDTLTDVRNFIAARCSFPGRATTQEILTEFRDRLPLSDSMMFRAMLRNICDFHRSPSGTGYWSLKSEFR